MAGIPLFRDVASAALTDYDFGAAPLISTLRYSVTGAVGAVGDLADGEEITDSHAKQTAKLIALLFALPAVNQILATGGHLSNVADGEDLTARGLLFGDKNK
jgi:hypothetical protein